MKPEVIGPVRRFSPTWMKRAPVPSLVTVVPQRPPCYATSSMKRSGKKWAWVSMLRMVAFIRE